MWTPATRGRMAEFEKKTKRYPTDLTDDEWARIEPFLPGAAKSGRPARTDLSEVLNAIRTIEIIRRSDTAQGFEVLPRRWVVERTFGWMTRWRRLARDYEERMTAPRPYPCRPRKNPPQTHRSPIDVLKRTLSSRRKSSARLVSCSTRRVTASDVVRMHVG
jgi:transposase